MNPFKWGIIGSIEKAQVFSADLPYANYTHSLEAFLADSNQTPSPDFIPNIYNNLQEFLQSEVDAVYIASPYQQHYAQVKQCLLNGKPVLCERPIAQNAGELKHLMDLSEHNHTFMMEAMWIRFLPSIRKMLSIISSGAIGEIMAVKASVSYKPNDTSTHLHSGGGALFELGIYPVFLCTLLLGRPEYVQAKGRRKEGGEEDFFSAFLSYPGGQYGFIEATRLTRGDSSATITGDKGSIVIKNPWSIKPEGIEVDFFDGTKVLHKSEWEGQGLHFELDEVYESVEEGVVESQLYCHHFSLDVMETMDDIRNQLQ